MIIRQAYSGGTIGILYNCELASGFRKTKFYTNYKTFVIFSEITELLKTLEI